jgi:predicted small secreted protein
MSWKKFLLGLGVGFASAYIIQNQVTDQTISGEKALRMVKAKFKTNGSIVGSWIHMVPESYTKFNIDYLIYRGGISTKINDDLCQFEFIVDSKSGTILDVIQV